MGGSREGGEGGGGGFLTGGGCGKGGERRGCGEGGGGGEGFAGGGVDTLNKGGACVLNHEISFAAEHNRAQSWFQRTRFTARCAHRA